MPERGQLVVTARQLLAVLEEIKAGGFHSQELIQQAKTLNYKLSPAYTHMYGRVPIIGTSYPNYVWWPRAYEHASQVLAALEAGLVSAEVDQTTDDVLSEASLGNPD